MATPPSAAFAADAGLDLAVGLLGRLVGETAAERRDQIAVGHLAIAARGPGRAAGLADDVVRRVAELREEGTPLFVDRVRIGGVASVELLDEQRVGALQKGRGLEQLVRR